MACGRALRYAGGMSLSRMLRPGRAYLFVGKGAAAHLCQLAAALALKGDVIVLDGGGGFNAYRTAHAIRARTAALFAVQARIAVARAFTCREVLHLLRHTPDRRAPVLILDLLATFYDEAVTDLQSYHLLSLCLKEVLRLQRRAPVVIALSPRHLDTTPGRARLLALLQQALEPINLEVFMGKTTPTINDLLREMEAALGRFRKVLHPAEKEHFDVLLVKARKHVAAIGEAAYLLPLEVAQLAIAFEQEKENLQRDQRLAELERRLEQLGNGR